MWAQVGCLADNRLRQAVQRERSDESKCGDQETGVDSTQGLRGQAGERARHLCLAMVLRFAVVRHRVIHARHVHRHGWQLLGNAGAQGHGYASLIDGDHVPSGDQNAQCQRSDADQRS